jgi:hypothetical protein
VTDSQTATGRWGYSIPERSRSFWKRFQWRRVWFGDGFKHSRGRVYVLARKRVPDPGKVATP